MIPPHHSRAAATRPGRAQPRRPASRDERSMLVLEILVALTAASAAVVMSLAR